MSYLFKAKKIPAVFVALVMVFNLFIGFTSVPTAYAAPPTYLLDSNFEDGIFSGLAQTNEGTNSATVASSPTTGKALKISTAIAEVITNALPMESFEYADEAAFNAVWPDSGGAFTQVLQTTPSKSGKALKASTASGGKAVTLRNLDSVANNINRVSFWFYDTNNTTATVYAHAQFGDGTNTIIWLVHPGVTATKYGVRWNGTYVQGPARSAGWHKVILDFSTGSLKIYMDGATTPFYSQAAMTKFTSVGLGNAWGGNTAADTGVLS